VSEQERTATLSSQQVEEIDTVRRTNEDTADRKAELELKNLELSDLDQYKGTDQYHTKVDEFIAGASAATIELIANDPASDPALVERIGLHNFYEELSYLEDVKGTPDYQMYVQMAVDDAPESVRDTLRNEPNLSEELATALYQPYSDELDAKEQTQTAAVEPPAAETTAPNTSEPNREPATTPLSLG
jgi:hypothetical protein